MTSQTPISPASGVLVLRELEIPGRTPKPIDNNVWGIGIAAVRDNFPRHGLQCLLGPWGNMDVGDLMRFYWGTNNQVLQGTVDEEERNKELTRFIRPERIGDGRHNVSYSVTRLGGVPEPSEIMKVFVKLTRPGGQDQNGDTPGHSELHMTIPREILDGGIDKDNVADGVPITIRPYPNMAVGDVIQVTWGGKFVLSKPLTQAQVDDPANNPIVVLVDEATIRAADDSDGSGLAVAFEVYDVVDNRSEDWSAEQRVVVAVNLKRLTAPIVKDAQNNVLDLDKLGNLDATVQILAVDNNFKLGDIIFLRVRGTPVEGEPIDIEIEGLPLDNIPSIAELNAPNAVLRLLAKTQVVFSYRLKKADGSQDLLSKGQFVRVIGETQRLKAPIARDAQQGAIDPELPSTRIEIPFDPSFNAGQAIKLFWLGTRPDHSTYLPDLGLRPITDGDIKAGKSLFITVQGDPHLKTLEGGTLELYYQLLIEDAVLGTLNRVNATHAIRESEHLGLLNVGEARLELPPPEVDGVVGGALDPDRQGTTLTVPYTQTVAGDTVFYQWVGSRVSDGDSVTLNSFTAGKRVPFNIKAELIKGNEGGWVEALYSIVQADGTRYSESLEFSVGVLETPAITSVKDSKGVDIPNGTTTVDTSATLSGTASRGQKIQLLNGATPVGPVIDVDANGNWTRQVTGLAQGAQNFTVKALYGSGSQSAAWTFEVITLLNDYTTFDGANLNGWAPGRGNIAAEAGNYFWRLIGVYTQGGSISKSFEWIPGATYEVSFIYRAGAIRPQGLKLQIDANGKLSFITITEISRWKEGSATFTADGTGRGVSLFFSGNVTDGAAYDIDNIRVKQII